MGEGFPLTLELLAMVLLAQVDGGVPPEPTLLEAYRAPFETLAERPIGEASRAVRFDWRNTSVGFGVTGSAMLELNNFASARIGGMVRKALGHFMLEFAVSWAGTWGSESSEQLGLTPYRQAARPRRLEIDINVSYTLAEGVVTARPGFLPAAQLTFNVVAGLRYLYYPGSMTGFSAGDVFAALFSARLDDREVINLESARLPGMQIERARLGVLAGLSVDLFFRPGIFVEPRVMMSLPIFSQGQGLSWWWELTLTAGVML
jgi:hypothetical protein